MDDIEVLEVVKGGLDNPTGQSWFDSEGVFKHWLGKVVDHTGMHPDEACKAIERLVKKGHMQVSSPMLGIVCVEVPSATSELTTI